MHINCNGTYLGKMEQLWSVLGVPFKHSQISNLSRSVGIIVVSVGVIWAAVQVPSSLESWISN